MEIVRFRHFFIALAIISSLFLTGCSKWKDIRVENYHIGSVSLDKRAVEAVVKLTVDNPSRQLVISDIGGRICLSGEEIAFYEGSSVVIDGKTRGEYPISCRLSVSDQISVFKFMSLASSSNIEDLTADFNAKVKLKGGVRKKIQVKDFPLKNLARK